MARNQAPKKTWTFGTCAFECTQPGIAGHSSKTKVLNIIVSFEEALKLDLAINECVRELNSYKRSTKKGRRTALNLAVHLHHKRLTINEDQLPAVDADVTDSMHNYPSY